MKLKRVLSVFAAAVLTLGMSACDLFGGGDIGKVGDVSKFDNVDEMEFPPESEEPQPETYEEYYEVMKQKSLCSLGYVNKMKDILDGARNGEHVTVAYIGGSITEGYTVNSDKCFAFLTYRHFVTTYGEPENCSYVNAGLSGTPSILGSFRLERDVLSYEPDIVFIEFAVNDGTDFNYQIAYEGIIRSIYEKNPNAAIVLLFSRTEDGYSAQDKMKMIGEYYDLPMISYADGLAYMFENEQLTWKDFSNDQSHPNVDGHVMVSDMIEYYLEQVDAAERIDEDYECPEPLLGETNVDCHILEGDVLAPESLGSWTAGSNINTFTNGWTFSGDKDNNEPIVFKVKGKTLYLLFKENSVGSGMATAQVTVTAPDGSSEVILINGETSGGWGDPTVSRAIKTGDEEQEYTVSIQIEEGMEDKQFQILGFGYNNR